MPRPIPDVELTAGQTATIQRVMDRFEFGKVHAAMVTVGWKWGTNIDEEHRTTLAVPNVARIREVAQDLLGDCYRWREEADADEATRIATGGFTATLEPDGILSLEFTLESADSEE